MCVHLAIIYIILGVCTPGNTNQYSKSILVTNCGLFTAVKRKLVGNQLRIRKIGITKYTVQVSLT